MDIISPSREHDPRAWNMAHYGGELLESDNAWGIPTLNPEMQVVELPETWIKWGTECRQLKGHAGHGVHFYCADYKFSALWYRSYQVPQAGYSVAIEPNFSNWEDLPLAVALWGIYRKRWLARTWQDAGVRVLVDMNSHPRFSDYALLGVPRGWKAFATRGYETRLAWTEREYERAREWAGEEIAFTVIGGHWRVAELCADRGWAHVSELKWREQEW